MFSYGSKASDETDAHTQKQGQRSQNTEDLMNRKEIQERFANTVSSYCWVGNQDQLQMARENAAEEMRFGLVEFIGKRNIPLLPANERWSFYSNFVDCACLNEKDRAEIRRAIEKKEENESK